MKTKKISDYPFWVQLIGSPYTYFLMILKLFVIIPIVVIAYCNRISSKINHP